MARKGRQAFDEKNIYIHTNKQTQANLQPKRADSRFGEKNTTCIHACTHAYMHAHMQTYVDVCARQRTATKGRQAI